MTSCEYFTITSAEAVSQNPNNIKENAITTKLKILVQNI